MMHQYLPEENKKKLPTVRKPTSYQDILKETDGVNANLRSSSCSASSQPELGKQFKEPEPIPKRFSNGRILKNSLSTIPVRDTYASKLRKIVSSTERISKHEENERNNLKYCMKPKWQPNSKVRYNVSTMIHVAKLKKQVQGTESETSSNSSKFESREELSEHDKMNETDFKGVELVRHNCKHGDFMEVKFPPEKQKSCATLHKNLNVDEGNFKFLVKTEEIFDSVPKITMEELQEDTKMVNENVPMNPNGKSPHNCYTGAENLNPLSSKNCFLDTETGVVKSIERIKVNEIGKSHKNHLLSISNRKKSSDGGKLQMDAQIDDELCNNTPQDDHDDEIELFPDESTQSWNITQYKSRNDKKILNSVVGNGKDLNISSPKNIETVDIEDSIISQSELALSGSKPLQDSIIITSRKYRKLDGSLYENESPSKIPYFIASISSNRKPLRVKAKCTPTLNESIIPISSSPSSQNTLSPQNCIVRQRLNASDCSFGFRRTVKENAHKTHIHDPENSIMVHPGKAVVDSSSVDSSPLSKSESEDLEEKLPHVDHKTVSSEYSYRQECSLKQLEPKVFKEGLPMKYPVGKREQSVQISQRSAKLQPTERDVSGFQSHVVKRRHNYSESNFISDVTNKNKTRRNGSELITREPSLCSNLKEHYSERVLDTSANNMPTKTENKEHATSDISSSNDNNLKNLLVLCILTLTFSCLFAYGDSINFELFQYYIDYFSRNMSEKMLSTTIEKM